MGIEGDIGLCYSQVFKFVVWGLPRVGNRGILGYAIPRLIKFVVPVCHKLGGGGRYGAIPGCSSCSLDLPWMGKTEGNIELFPTAPVVVWVLPYI